MAKPYQYASLICLILTFLAAVGIVWGLVAARPLITVLFLLPTVAYEAYRTEGESTKLASWGLLVTFILEIIFIVGQVSFDLGEFLGIEEHYVAGYLLPLGDIKVVGPAVMAILSIVLFTRTRGRYTKWLAVIIFITSFAIVYVLDPTVFTRLLKVGIEEGLERVE